MGDLNLAPYVVRREADRWLFIPSAALIAVMTFARIAVGAFMVYLSTLFFRHAVEAALPTTLFGPALLLGGCLLAVSGIRAWRARHTPLSVETGGRVCYGEQELCAAGTVRSVQIVESHGGEPGDSEVVLEVADGNPVYIPSQYFAGFKSRKQARPFAAKLAEVLAVPMTEQS
jgi:uncharacterized protein (DUF779 family)